MDSGTTETYRVERRTVRRDRRSSATRTARMGEKIDELRWYIVRESDGRDVKGFLRKRDAERELRRRSR